MNGSGSAPHAGTLTGGPGGCSAADQPVADVRSDFAIGAHVDLQRRAVIAGEACGDHASSKVFADIGRGSGQQMHLLAGLLDFQREVPGARRHGARGEWAETDGRPWKLGSRLAAGAA
jgi:hypothetical protein